MAELLDQLTDDHHWHHLEVDQGYDARGLAITTVYLDGRVLDVKRVTISGRMPPIGAANRVASNLDTGGEGEEGGPTDTHVDARRAQDDKEPKWRWWQWKARTLPVSAGICPDALAGRHVELRDRDWAGICALCSQRLPWFGSGLNNG